MNFRIRLTILLLVASFYSQAQVVSFSKLFQQKSGLRKDFHSLVADYQPLQLNQQNLSTLRGQLTRNAELSLPFENKDLALQV